MNKQTKQKISPAEVQQFLDGVDYPAQRDELVDYAREQGADEEILDVLDHIPDHEYETRAEVTRAVSEVEI